MGRMFRTFLEVEIWLIASSIVAGKGLILAETTLQGAVDLLSYTSINRITHIPFIKLADSPFSVVMPKKINLLDYEGVTHPLQAVGTTVYRGIFRSFFQLI